MTQEEIETQFGIKKTEQMSWDSYFLNIASKVGKQSTCDRGKCGCVITKDQEILVFGAADAPHGSPTCQEVGHQMWHMIHEDRRETEHCMRNNCAEQVAIAKAARKGIALEGATLYVTMTPCTVRHCAHLIIACGIRRVVCSKRYHDFQESETLFRAAKVELTYLDESIETY